MQHAVTVVIRLRGSPHDQGRHAFGDRERRAQYQLRAIVCYAGQNSAEKVLTGAKQAGTVNNPVLNQQHCPQSLVLRSAKTQRWHHLFTGGAQQWHGTLGLLLCRCQQIVNLGDGAGREHLPVLFNSANLLIITGVER
ncbi:hypothetical protein D3C75_955870 [compost metagenome]